jgi:hypothetical protein
MIYEGSPAKHLHGLATICKRWLGANYRCLYLNSPEIVEEMGSALAAAGVEVADAIERGALVLSSDRSHMIDDRFCVQDMVSMVADSVNEALKDGYTGLWASGDMAWEFGNETNFAKLVEYEHTLDELFAMQPALSGVCQYHAETLPTEVIRWGQYTHPMVYVNEALWQPNPYYSPGRSADCAEAGFF